MNLLHVRHATSVINYGGKKILIDPVLAQKEAYPAIPGTPNQRRNPLVELSTPLANLLQVDMILSTHTHKDHFDDLALELLDKSLPLVCQSEDSSVFERAGFQEIYPISDYVQFGNLTITRVKAQHGLGAIGSKMGIASGYILKAEGEPTLYITGDTVYTKEVKENIEKFQPQVFLINAGAPRFLLGQHIVMNLKDVEAAIKVKPNAIFLIVHLDSYNHCVETREKASAYFNQQRLIQLGVKRLIIPCDNEFISEAIFKN